MNSKEMRVFGPPGCGKTTWISKHIPVWVDKYGRDQISVCSLTNAAVREIVGRDLDINPDNLSTLHSRCKRVLFAGDPAESRISDFLKQYPQYQLDFPGVTDKSGTSTDDDLIISGHSSDVMKYTKANLLRQKLVPYERWDSATLEFHKNWVDWMKYNGILDFTGWLETAMKEDALPYQDVVIADEAQDHTPLQISVIRNWRARYRILVGDDDQNLYQWTGASPEGFLNPPLPHEQELVLDQSYRVPRQVQLIAERIISKVRNRKSKIYNPRDHEGVVRHSSLSLKDFILDNDHNDFMIDYLRYPPDSTFMLLASTSFQVKQITDYLYSRRIPFHNPYRRSNFAWNPMQGLSEPFQNYLSRSLTGKSLSSWLPFLAANEVFLPKKKEEFIRLCETRGDQEVEVSELKSHINEFFIDMILTGDLTLLMNHRRRSLLGSWNYMLDIHQGKSQVVQPRVIVGTIHSVKGGEADHVYVFPDISRSAAFSNDLNINDSMARLFYVAVTRSRDTLTLASPSTRWAYDYWS